MRSSVSMLVLPFCLLACAHTPPPASPSVNVEAERAALMRVDAEFSAMSVARGMQAAFAAYLGDDAKSFPPGQPVISGRDAIVADMAVPAGRPPATLSWEPQGAELSTAADFGYTYGRYTLATTNAAGAKVERHGKYLTVWKRAPGQPWKIAADIGNADP
jgi:ketosteroid isomerase-like protein